MIDFPFPFLGHSLGTTTDDYTVQVLFSDDISHCLEIQKIISAEQTSKRVLRIDLASNQIKYAIGHDREFTDDPKLLDNPVIYKTFNVEFEKLSDVNRRFLHYVYNTQIELEKAHQHIPILACCREMSARAKPTEWHQWSMDRLPEIFDHLVDVLSDKDILNQRFSENYTNWNCYSSPAGFIYGFLKTLFRTHSQFKKLSPKIKEKIAACLVNAMGYDNNTDNYLIAAGMLLRETDEEKIMADYTQGFPSSILEHLRRLNTENLDTSTRIFD
ncbi:MAG: hypothetical protein K6L75_12320 [Cellvibrionaceae bacterium]